VQAETAMSAEVEVLAEIVVPAEATVLAETAMSTKAAVLAEEGALAVTVLLVVDLIRPGRPVQIGVAFTVVAPLKGIPIPSRADPAGVAFAVAVSLLRGIPMPARPDRTGGTAVTRTAMPVKASCDMK